MRIQVRNNYILHFREVKHFKQLEFLPTFFSTDLRKMSEFDNIACILAVSVIVLSFLFSIRTLISIIFTIFIRIIVSMIMIMNAILLARHVFHAF